MKCARCRRQLRNPVYLGGSPYGSTCAAALSGAKPKRRQRAQQPQDERQAALFDEVTP